jgi:peptidoglycan/LPS O-acetylase OafA/YrhL
MFEATKNASVDRAVGELSYPLYLVHGFVQGAVFPKLHTRIDSTLLVTICCLAASIVASIMMRLLVERPVEIRRSRIAKAAIASA